MVIHQNQQLLFHAPAGGIDAKAVAVVSYEYVTCEGKKGGTVTGIHLSNPGCGYTVVPTITFLGGGSGALLKL